MWSFLKVSCSKLRFSEGRKCPFQAFQASTSPFFSETEPKPKVTRWGPLSWWRIFLRDWKFGWIKWVFPKIVVFPPKSSILIGFSIINHPFWGTPIFGNTQNGKWPTVLLDAFVFCCLILFLFVCSLFSGWKVMWKKNMMRWKTREIILILLPTKAAWTCDEACDIHPLLQANMVNPSTNRNNQKFRMEFHQFSSNDQPIWKKHESKSNPNPTLCFSLNPSCFGVPIFVPPFFLVGAYNFAAWLSNFRRSKHSSSKTRHRRAS